MSKPVFSPFPAGTLVSLFASALLLAGCGGAIEPEYPPTSVAATDILERADAPLGLEQTQSAAPSTLPVAPEAPVAHGTEAVASIPATGGLDASAQMQSAPPPQPAPLEAGSSAQEAKAGSEFDVAGY